MIIEDDNSIRYLLELFLKKYFSIDSKADGMEAMLWLDAGNMPDLIIADIEMPRLNGYEFIKNIKRSGFFKEIPVIILTGWDNADAKNKCLQEGADEFITKPFNPTQLLLKIENLLKEQNNYKYA